MAKLPVRARQLRRLFSNQQRFEILIAFGLLLISVVSVYVAYSANRTQERILAASVWPSLTFGTSDLSPDGAPQLSLDLLNRGVGPAKVRWAEVLYGGEPVSGPRSLLAACCGVDADAAGLTVINTAIQRRVVGAGEWIQFLRIQPADASAPAYEALGASIDGVRVRLCYCSVLEQCWLLRSELPEPVPVRACPATPAVLWESAS